MCFNPSQLLSLLTLKFSHLWAVQPNQISSQILLSLSFFAFWYEDTPGSSYTFSVPGVESTVFPMGILLKFFIYSLAAEDIYYISIFSDFQEKIQPT